MSSIMMLPGDLQNKIAAGEVIERPASVVKELLENSIDAGATEIRVDILQGGSKLIRVVDNGPGMKRDDALLCFRQHATSKIQTEDDLSDIKTMGFRGEALSSIASVSRLSIMTAPASSPGRTASRNRVDTASTGTHIDIEGGRAGEPKDIAHIGTTVEVHDLFFNTPARKKFLKSRRTEVHHIVETVTRVALSHPEISFQLTIERVENLILPKAGSYRERILQVYGEDFCKGLIEIKDDGVTAMTSREGNFRSTRANQYLFINRRPISDASIRHALYRAYDTFLPKNEHPIFFIYLEVSPSEVDFNVHPTKREVRFQDKESIYRMVSSSIRRALRVRGFGSSDAGDTLKSADFVSKHSAGEPSSLPISRKAEARNSYPESHISQQQTPDISLLSESFEGYKGLLKHIYLGDVFVACTSGSGVTLLDHHAAHERILYERLRNGVELEPIQLLFPKQVRLPAKEYGTILAHISGIRDMGIEIEDFGHNTIIVRSLPRLLINADIGAIISDVAGSLTDFRSTSPLDILKERIAMRVACHSSVRGSTELNSDEVSSLLSDLSKAEDPEHCPHGRPTRIHFSIAELRKIFKRV